jgi:hypothetical protein
MENSPLARVLSAKIEAYKARLETVSIVGTIETDDELGILRIIPHIPEDAAPICAEVRLEDVKETVIQKGDAPGRVVIRKGADYCVRITVVSGFEDDLPKNIHNILFGLGEVGKQNVRV